MLHTSNSTIIHKAGLPNLVKELGNVLKSCKVMVVSRDTFYRDRELVDDGRIRITVKSDNMLDKQRQQVITLRHRR